MSWGGQRMRGRKGGIGLPVMIVPRCTRHSLKPRARLGDNNTAC